MLPHGSLRAEIPSQASSTCAQHPSACAWGTRDSLKSRNKDMSTTVTRWSSTTRTWLSLSIQWTGNFRRLNPISTQVAPWSRNSRLRFFVLGSLSVPPSFLWALVCLLHWEYKLAWNQYLSFVLTISWDALKKLMVLLFESSNVVMSFESRWYEIKWFLFQEFFVQLLLEEVNGIIQMLWKRFLSFSVRLWIAIIRIQN